MTGKRSAEKSFAELVDRTFAADDAAISKGRTLIAARAATAHPSAQIGSRLPRWRAIVGAGALAGAAVLVLVAVGGRDRPAPIGGVGSMTPSAIASISTSIGRSSADLDAILAAAGSGDSASFAAVVSSYQGDLDAVSAELARPGANVAALDTKLKAEKVELARALQVASAANRGLVVALQAKLDRILASLGDGPPPAPSGHGSDGGAGGNGNGGSGNGGSGSGGSSGGGGANGGSAGGSGNGGGNGSGGIGKGHPRTK
jgi:uncharacterized membrane protein YgcG